MTGDVLRFPRPLNLSSKEAANEAVRILQLPVSDRAATKERATLEHPETLLAICEMLRSKMETTPAVVQAESEFFYRFLESPSRPIGYFDEREYFLGEFALMAGAACRFQFRRDEARAWFDRAEAYLALAAGTSANVCRIAYQRLALALEERRLDEVLDLAPTWSKNAVRLGLVEEGIKFLFLKGGALRELDRIEEAIETFSEISTRASESGNVRLLAQAENGLAQFERVQGRLDQAMSHAQKALPLLTSLNSRVQLAKLRWCVGDILREQGNLAEAIDAYRDARNESEEIGLRGDLAAIHLVLADVLLQSGQDAQAEWEVRAALPIIDEEKMVPEGFAALSLLRESLRRRKLDRNALRTLHGYFKD
jgi:tetratricopeptide (TPR) repeat protein